MGGESLRRVFQWACGLFLAFVGGAAVTVFHVFPYELVSAPLGQLAALLHKRRPTHWFPARFPTAGVTASEPEKIAPGLTLITTFWPGKDGAWKPGARLIDATGKVVHEWVTDPMKLWPEQPYQDPFVKRDEETYIHGTYLFPNGDLLFNLDYIGLQRVDACGKIVWQLKHRTHHAISADEDGTFWTLGVVPFEPGAQQTVYPGLKGLSPYVDESVLHVTADGKILSETSILRSLFDSGYGELITLHRGALLEEHDDAAPGSAIVFTHANDVEPLSSALAPRFPMFAAGDLVVSLRKPSTVFVMDRAGHIKWLTDKHTVKQHDPDFEPDGTITIYDNHADGTESGQGSLLGTRIVALDPANDHLTVRYPLHPGDRLYSAACGKHQLLPNGNRLITEARAGRALEVDPTGSMVWQWVHTPHDHQVTEVLEATRYPYDAATVAKWSCAPPP